MRSLDCRCKARVTLYDNRCIWFYRFCHCLSERSVSLYRNGSLSDPVCAFLQFPLKGNPTKRRLILVILRRHRNDHGAVTVIPVAAAVAHTVHGQPPRFRRSVDHIATRTHTKGIDTPARRSLCRHLIAGRRQQWVVCTAVLHPIDHPARMFHA